jgi:hypothetical protein
MTMQLGSNPKFDQALARAQARNYVEYLRSLGPAGFSRIKEIREIEAVLANNLTDRELRTLVNVIRGKLMCDILSTASESGGLVRNSIARQIANRLLNKGL